MSYLISCFVSVIFHVRKHNQSERTLAKQLRSNHRISFKTHQKNSAVTMMGLVIGVFLVCYGIHLRCSLVVLFDTNESCKDEQFKIPVLVLNSAVNPLSYAFFKRDMNKELRNFIEHGMGQHALYRNSYGIIISGCLLKPITARSLL